MPGVKILHVQILQIQLHVNNIVQVKYAPKWFEEDASWRRPSVRYLCKTASDGRAASKRGASWNAVAHKQPTTTTTITNNLINHSHNNSQPHQPQPTIKGGHLGMLLINNQQPQPQPQPNHQHNQQPQPQPQQLTTTATTTNNQRQQPH